MTDTLYMALFTRFVAFTALLAWVLLGCQSNGEPQPDDETRTANDDAPAVEEDAPLAEDQEANVYIPAQERLTSSLRVGVAYNDSHVSVVYEYETDNPSWYHDYLVYEDGEWTRIGRGVAGPQPFGLNEDRISMALDDGSVEGYDYWGGYVTMHPGVQSRTDAAPEDIRKFLEASRSGELDDESWQRHLPEEQLDELREAGTFFQTWQWRAHRSNPVGFADPGYVLAQRHSAGGESMYATNWDGEAEQPLYMYDPAEHDGMVALERERVEAREYTQDDPYYLNVEQAVPFDPEHEWQDGDTLPRRYLQQPSGSRGALTADGRYEDGAWRVRITRTLEAPDPLDSKSVEPGQTYNVAFAVHADATQGRWHYTSMPLPFSLDDEEAHLRAVYTEGELDEAEVEWLEVPLFYPGQAYLEWLRDNGHPVHEAYAAAHADPLDADAVRTLATALAEHELAWLREMGIDVATR